MMNAPVQVMMRLEALEKSVIPSTRQYIDQAQQTFWAPTQAEIQVGSFCGVCVCVCV